MNLKSINKKNLINLFVFSWLFFNLPFLFNLKSEELIQKNTKFELINKEYLEKSPDLDYILGIGDQIIIDYGQRYKVLDSGSLNLASDFKYLQEIDINGKVNLKKYGSYYVEGLSIKELNSLLTKELSNYIKKPSLEITINKYRNVRVFVGGQVESPGYYVLPGKTTLNQQLQKTSELGYLPIDDQNVNFRNKNNNFAIEYHPTIFDAIKNAGGITNNADLSKLEVLRNNLLSNGGGKIHTNINFLKAIKDGDSSKNIRIYDGDSIFIKKSEKIIVSQISEAIRSNLNPKFINVFVSGRVEFPGPKTVRKLSSLNDAIEIAGGAKVIKGPVILTRYKNDGEIYRKEFNYKKIAKRGSESNPYLKSGDIIRVSKSKLNIANEILDDLTSPLRGIVTSYGIYKIFNDL